MIDTSDHLPTDLEQETNVRLTEGSTDSSMLFETRVVSTKPYIWTDFSFLLARLPLLASQALHCALDRIVLSFYVAGNEMVEELLDDTSYASTSLLVTVTSGLLNGVFCFRMEFAAR